MRFRKAACPAFWSKMTVFGSTLASSMLRRDIDTGLSLSSHTWLYASFYAIITKINFGRVVDDRGCHAETPQYPNAPNAPSCSLLTTFSQKSRFSHGRGKVDRRHYCVKHQPARLMVSLDMFTLPMSRCSLSECSK